MGNCLRSAVAPGTSIISNHIPPMENIPSRYGIIQGQPKEEADFFRGSQLPNLTPRPSIMIPIHSTFEPMVHVSPKRVVDEGMAILLMRSATFSGREVAKWDKYQLPLTHRSLTIN
ncbi:putative fatty acid synthase-like [Sesbania bispinosa]|nr:putative fatty acid synthase-like [Sesbania bispinosa]